MIKSDKEIEQWGPIDGKVLYPSFWFWATAKKLYKKTGIAWPVYYGIFDHDRMTYLWYKQDMQTKGEIALKKIILNSIKCKKFYHEYISICKKASALKNLTIPIEKKFDLLFDYLLNIWTYALIAEVANFASPDYLRKLLRKYVGAEQIDQVMEIMMAPEKLSFLQTGERTLYQVALKAKGKADLLLRFKEYAKEWSWLENNYYQNKILTANYFYNQVKHLSKKEIINKLRVINQHERTVIKKKLVAGEKFHLSKDLMKQIKQIAFSIWWQDHRKGIVWQLYSLADELIKATGKKYGLGMDDLYYYSGEEWQRLWRSGRKVSAKEIKLRKKFFVLMVANGYYKLYYGKKAKGVRKLLDKKDQVKSGSIKGIVVSRTKDKIVRGTVRVITSPRYASKMKSGDILVAPMTSPDFIVAMRKAKAVITDVGGLMSHAAVVSRELHIPCIVNTKVATKVLKDGDLVEVDTNKGIVKIL